MGTFDYRLTRSIHRSYAVKSGEGIVCSEARGSSESAHRGTGKNSWYSEVLVRTLCSWVVSFLLQGVNPLQVLCTIPPLGIVNRKSTGRLEKTDSPLKCFRPGSPRIDRRHPHRAESGQRR